MRIITNAEFRARSGPLFTQLGILDIFKVSSFYVARFMFCYKNLLLPPILLNLFITNNEVHNYIIQELLRIIVFTLVEPI